VGWVEVAGEVKVERAVGWVEVAGEEKAVRSIVVHH
jgi:hypothetical protein